MAKISRRVRIYKVWHQMRRRCEDPNDIGFNDYGGRGIRVCARWSDFENFMTDMGPSYERGLRIERYDNDAGYAPANCGWVTAKEQARNRRDNLTVNIGGKERLLIEAVEETNLTYNAVWKRLKRGWPVERALGMEVV